MQRRTWIGGLLAVLLLALYVATAGATPSVDTASASLQGWRIATTGQPWLEDVDLDALPYDPQDPPWWIGEAAGHDVVFRSPGVTAASTLAYLGGDDDPARFRVLPASLLAAVLAWLAMLLLYGALHPSLGRRTSLAVTAVVALGTPVWSVAADAMWPHTLTVLGLAGMAYAASRERWLLAGVLGGLGLTGRLHLSLVVGLLGAGTGLLRRRWQVTALVAAGSLPFLLLSAAWSRWLYGQWDPAGGYPQVDAYAGRAASTSPLDSVVNELGLLVSPDRGLLVWTPVIIVLLPALARSWRDQPDWTRALAIGGLAYTGVQGLMNHFAGGETLYGYRLPLELLLAATPALALALPHAGRVARGLLPPLAGLQVGAIALGAVFESPGLVIEEAWTHNAFLDLVAGVPVLVVPWLLCGLLGVLVARASLDRSTSAAEQAHQRA